MDRILSDALHAGSEKSVGLRCSLGGMSQDYRDEYVAQGKALLASRDFAGAEQLLRRACAADPAHALLWWLLTTACWELGQHDEALAAIQRAIELAVTEDFIVRKGWMLYQRGALNAAEAVLRDAVARFPGSFSAHQNLTQVYKNLEQWDNGAAEAEQACVLNPDDFDMRASWSSCLLRANREREALSVIEEGLQHFQDPSSRFQLLMQKAVAHQELGEVHEAVDALAAALIARPDDELALRRLCALALGNRLRDLAHPYRQRLYDLEKRHLPDRLKDGLAAIWEGTGDCRLDPDALQWAWELADKSRWAKDKWETAAARGKQASILLNTWRETGSPKEFYQLDELVEAPDASELSAAAMERSACFVVGAHIGQHTLAIRFLERGNRGYRVIGSPDREYREQDILIPITSNSTHTARAIISEIRNGVTVGLAADNPLTRFYISFEFLGRHIEVPAYVPKIIRMRDAASFWCFPRWQNGRIVVELDRLPDPLEEESHVDWCGRWFRAYLARLERAMRSRPENLVLFSGIWGNVNQAVLSARRKVTGRKKIAAFVY